ncbi:MAG: M6 family metalloprotease domain-containing protein [Chitinispirillia bacterium]|nr:M6 family metalloprotease domain-containing protein [Chitinispirillia bacterium]
MQKRLAGMDHRSLFYSGIRACVVLLAFVSAVIAAPHSGEEIMLSQPDGSEVPVIIWGDELYAVAECPDGFTLVRGADGWISYAELSEDGQLVSTGVRYTAASRAPGARRNLRSSDRVVLEKQERNRRNMGDGEREQGRGFRGKFGVRGRDNSFRPAPDMDGEFQPSPYDEFQSAPGDTTHVVGVVLFIAFPDFPAPNDGGRFLRYADSAYNHLNFRGNGSVRDYFNDVSNGMMQYTNYISAWVTAPNTFAYYDGADNYGRVQELITAALTELNRNTEVAAEIGRRVSTYERNWGGSIGRQRTAIALNIHPIRSGQRWSHGIWSHRGWFRNGNITVGGVRFYDYQFTGLGNTGTITNSSTISLGVVIHENGHMLFDWPDLYPYVSGQRNFVRTYCIMSSTGSPPQTPNPFFRSLEGWINVTDVTNTNAVLTHVANSHTAFRYVRDATESYFIEARRRTGRSAGIPGEGLILWHIHTRGDNANYDVSHTNAARRIPRVAVVQADNGTGNPGANAPFIAGSGSRNTQFHRNSTPAARYHSFTSNNASATSPWTGEFSNINITEVSAINTATNSMTFRIGTGGGTTTPTPLTAAMLSIPAQTFTGSALTPVLTVRDGSRTLVAGTDYTVTLTPRTNAGTYAITVTGRGSYTGTASVNFVVNPRALTAAMLSIPAQTYNGSARTPVLTVTDGSRTLVSGTDFTATLTQRTNAGTTAITVTGAGNYTGTAAVNFVVNPRTLIASMLSIPAQTFTGSALTPVLTVTDGSRPAPVAGTDYTVALTPRTDAGTYAITVTGARNYTGTAAVNFVVNPRPLAGAVVTVGGAYTFTGSALTPAAANVTVALTGFTGANAPAYNTAVSNNINAGTATVTVTGTGNFTGTATGTFTIAPRALTASDVTLTIPAQTFTGEALTPVLTVRDAARASGARTLVAGTDYTADLTPQTAAGTYPVTVTGMGNYTGTATVNFVIQGATSVLSSDRVTPNVQPGESLEMTPVILFAGELTAGPNPASRQSNTVSLFWQGRRIQSASLSVFDASGNVVVSSVSIRDNAAGASERRQVGSWNLKDSKGRTVAEGTYLVKGTITVDGKKERVSVMVGVR